MLFLKKKIEILLIKIEILLIKNEILLIKSEIFNMGLIGTTLPAVATANRSKTPPPNSRFKTSGMLPHHYVIAHHRHPSPFKEIFEHLD